jgi:hypothetical protein
MTIPYFQEDGNIVAIAVHPALGPVFIKCETTGFRTTSDREWEGTVLWAAPLPSSSSYGEEDGKLTSEQSFDEGVSFIKDNYPPDWYAVRRLSQSSAATKQRYQDWIEMEVLALKTLFRENALKAGFKESSPGVFKLPGFPWKLGLLTPDIDYTRYLVEKEATYNRQVVLAIYDFPRAAERIRKVAASKYGEQESRYLESPLWVWWTGKIYLTRGGVVNVDDL